MTFSEIMQAPQFIVGQSGKPTAVVLTLPVWEEIAAMLEDYEDFQVLQSRLQNWRTKKGWTRWEEIEPELAE